MRELSLNEGRIIGGKKSTILGRGGKNDTRIFMRRFPFGLRYGSNLVRR
jgi:hypothetical protein